MDVTDGDHRSYYPVMQPNNSDVIGISEEAEVNCFLSFITEPYPTDGTVLFCNTTWDGLSCWPTTAANSVKTISCFPVLNEVPYDISHNATRFCSENGQWANKSDYSACRPLIQDDDSLQVLWDVKEAGTIYYVGYGMSLVALTLALWIFFYFRDLRCLRNTIHTNLMVTYILIDLTWIITATLLSSTNLTSKKAACFLVIFLTYLLGTNYFWMFVEGLYLYVLVVKTFSVERIKIALFFVIGWGIPAIVVVVWASVKSYFALSGDDRVSPSGCLWQVRDNYDYIFMCPVVIILVVNCFFLGKIMYVLITKLRAANTAESKQYRKAAKALLVLIPLLGITYIIVLVTPTERAARVVFTYLQATLLSTQGFTVAVLYCFLNGEVRNSMRHHLERWKTQRTLSNAHHHSVKYGAVGSGNNPCADDSAGVRDRDSCISMTTTTICINTHCNKCAGDNNGCSYCAVNFRDEMV